MPDTITIPMRAARDAFAVIASIKGSATFALADNVLVLPGDGAVTLRRVTGDVSIEAVVPCEGASKPFTLPAALTSEILGLATGESLAIENRGNIARLCHGIGEHHDLVTLPAEDYPVPRIGKPGATIVMPADDLAAAIKRVAWAVPGKDHRRVLMGLHLREQGGALTMCGTDGKKLARLKLNRVAPEGFAATLPPQVFTHLMRGGSGEAVIEIDDEGRTVRATMGNTTIMAGLFEGRYPDVDAVIPKTKPRLVLDWRGKADAMVRAVKRAAVTAEDKNKSIIIELGEAGCTITSSAADVGASSVPAPCDYEGDMMAVAFNHALLTEAIQASGATRLALTSEAAPALFLGDDALTTVLMPIKLADARVGASNHA